MISFKAALTIYLQPLRMPYDSVSLSYHLPQAGPWQPSGFRAFLELLKFLLKITKVVYPLGKALNTDTHTYFLKTYCESTLQLQIEDRVSYGALEAVTRWGKKAFCNEREPRESTWPPTECKYLWGLVAIPGRYLRGKQGSEVKDPG